MPRLVHIAPLAEARKIRRNGIRARKVRGWIDGCDRFVWAFPILPSYVLTHSWMRELKRMGATSLVAVTFKVDDDQRAFVRHYREQPVAMPAADAAGIIHARPDPRGYEIVLPRSIEPHEIVRIAVLPKGRVAVHARSQIDRPLAVRLPNVRAARRGEGAPVSRKVAGVAAPVRRAARQALGLGPAPFHLCA